MIGTVLANKYEITEKVGGGGMANVYKARRLRDDRVVAIKALKPEFLEDEEFVARFKREAHAVSGLKHPSIVDTIDVGEENGVYFIVMEYVEGETLKDSIRRNGALNVEAAIHIGIQICRALDYAHAHRVIHRDIKPQNILVSVDGTVKVADFGIAKGATSSTVTIAGSNIMGSVHYSSPEQARGGFTDEKSDLYSLGVVLYEAVTGKVPFEGDTPVTVAIKHIQEKPVPPSHINPLVPRALEEIILKAMEKETGLRYDSAREMEQDLIRCLSEPNGAFVTHFKPGAETFYIPADKVKEMADEKTREPAKRKAPPPKKAEPRTRPEQPKEEPKRAKSAWQVLKILLGVLALLVVAGGLFMAGRGFYNNSIKNRPVMVTNVVGKTEAEARTALEGDFTVEVAYEYDMNVEKDHVVSQNPLGASSVKKGSTVKLVVSLGRERVVVPTLVNTNFELAAQELQKSQLQVGQVHQEEAEGKTVGSILRQSPDPGTEALAGDTVDIWVCVEPSTVVKPVPDVVGMRMDEARQRLLNEGFSNVEVVEEVSETAAGEVLRQDPSMNSTVDVSTKIQLWVTKAPEFFYQVEANVDLTVVDDGSTILVELVDKSGQRKTIMDEVKDAGDYSLPLVLTSAYPDAQTLIVYVNGQELTRRDVDFSAGGQVPAS